MMATHYPIVFEREESGAYSAYVAGLPVYAQGATRGKAATAIVRTLGAYLEAHPDEQPRAEVRVAKVSVPARRRTRPRVSLVTAAALVGSRTSDRKAATSRAMAVSAGGRERSSRISMTDLQPTLRLKCVRNGS
jgi:predicted RNase H-like HicB family nuclease